MQPFRRSGSFVALTWQGKVPDPELFAAFAARLAERRFRSIDTAASEEVSIGWVSSNDPSGNSFDDDAILGSGRAWLRMRVDVKRMPKDIIAQHVAEAERARGKRLSARERRELKEDLAEKLLPRVLPVTKTVDALLMHEDRLVLLFATSKAHREAFAKLFCETFGVPLDGQGPLQLALRGADAGRRKHLDQLQPTRWPVDRREA